MNSFRVIVTFVLLIFWFHGFAQQNDSVVFVEDSMVFEKQRNYLGVNFSPLLTSAFGGANKNVKLNLIYKRNYGDKNLRLSANYVTVANRMSYPRHVTIGTTDSSVTNRYYSGYTDQVDFRIGFEELKGYNLSRFHVGADLLLGYAQYHYDYEHVLLLKDTSGYYLANKGSEPIYSGYHNSSFYTVGLDVSFGFDWFVSKEFMFTFQLTPQFNYYIFEKEKIVDQFGQFHSALNYADFTLGYFDVYMIYRF